MFVIKSFSFLITIVIVCALTEVLLSQALAQSTQTTVLAQAARQAKTQGQIQNIKDGACQDSTLRTRLVPIPLYSTLPNEGSTFGVMSVFLKVCDKDQRIKAIYAPSLSTNDTIQGTGTFRYYYYPSELKNLSVIASASTYVNWNSLIKWQDLPLETGAMTEEFTLRTERSIFYRFFGLGPDTPASAESSYTLTHEMLYYRKGLNLASHFNIGLGVNAENDSVGGQAVTNLPVSPVVFPNAPGMNGSAISGEFIDLRYDSRGELDYSVEGTYADLQTTAMQGLYQAPGYAVSQIDARQLFPETNRLSGAVRMYASYIYTPDVPFYDESSLGGSFLMRGFTENRFYDQGAWTLEAEQRIRVLQTHFYGVTTDWRVDPFVAIGQVYHDANSFFSHTQVAEGLGFRAWVRPNIVGRVDAAYAGEGLKFYVELGYPF